MTTFDERRGAYEAKFAHDEELRFKATARRNRLLGLWAAERLGKTGADADAYARQLVRAEVVEVGEHDVLHRIREDFAQAGVQATDREIEQMLHDLMVRAVADVEASR